MTSTFNKEIELARLNGFLEAFQEINRFTNHGAWFGFHKIPFYVDLQKSLDTYMRRNSKTDWWKKNNYDQKYNYTFEVITIKEENIHKTLQDITLQYFTHAFSLNDRIKSVLNLDTSMGISVELKNLLTELNFDNASKLFVKQLLEFSEECKLNEKYQLFIKPSVGNFLTPRYGATWDDLLFKGTEELYLLQFLIDD